MFHGCVGCREVSRRVLICHSTPVPPLTVKPLYTRETLIFELNSWYQTLVHQYDTWSVMVLRYGCFVFILLLRTGYWELVVSEAWQPVDIFGHRQEAPPKVLPRSGFSQWHNACTPAWNGKSLLVLRYPCRKNVSKCLHPSITSLAIRRLVSLPYRTFPIH